MRSVALNGGFFDRQGAANAAAPQTPPQAAPGQAAAPAAVVQPLTAQQIRDQLRNDIRNDIRNGVRNGGNPTINIPSDFNLRNAVPQGAVDISLAFFITIGFCVVGLPLARAFARRMDRRSDALASGTNTLAPQIEQLQQSVDALAIEMERITEAQRFQSKLMAGKAEEPAKLAR